MRFNDLEEAGETLCHQDAKPETTNIMTSEEIRCSSLTVRDRRAHLARYLCNIFNITYWGSSMNFVRTLCTMTQGIK
jgi:hypothetical protein